MAHEEDNLSKELELTEGSKMPAAPSPMKELTPEMKKELSKIKEKIDKFGKDVVKKIPYVLSIGLLPALPHMAQSAGPRAGGSGQGQGAHDKEKKKPELIIVLPDEKVKEIKKIEKDLAEILKKVDLDATFFTRTTQELWQTCFDGHYADMDRISMSYPVHDKGILSALRVASIHKNLVLRKFERYVTSYVIAGSLVRGQATKTSDVDIYVVIDDTDVKRMSRYELKERLRAMIYSYAFEANEIAGAKNKLSPQVYILTEFWESVKDANPVIFTFIRDGVPFYDRGAFMPWKLLLKMGKIKPSQEAIDNFMLLGERVGKKVKEDLNRIVTEDIYWGVITPSQAALMLYGLPPPTPRETVELMDKTFVEKEGLLEKKYIKILDKVVTLYKDYEHGRPKEVKGKDVDELLTEVSEYMQRLKELVKQIEKKAGENTVLKIHEDAFSLLETILGKGVEQRLVDKFKEKLVDRGEMTQRSLEVLKEIVRAKQDHKKGKLSRQEIDRVRKDAQEFMRALTEHEQRKNLLLTEKSRFRIKIGEKQAELFIFADEAFLIAGEKKEVLKADLKKKKLESSNMEELAEKLKNAPKELELGLEKIQELKKLFGKDFTFLF